MIGLLRIRGLCHEVHALEKRCKFLVGILWIRGVLWSACCGSGLCDHGCNSTDQRYVNIDRMLWIRDVSS
jgi:hypothetical protein